MANKKSKSSKLEKMGLDGKALNRTYVQAKITATPYDYSLRDRIVLEPNFTTYYKITNTLNMGNDTELKLAARLGAYDKDPAELRYARSSLVPGGRTYDFKNLNWNTDAYLEDDLLLAMQKNDGYMYKHNDMVINEESFTEFAEANGAKAACALMGLYVRLYAADSIIPQLALTLFESTRKLGLDDVANLSFVKEALEKGTHHVPSIYCPDAFGATLAQMQYLTVAGLYDRSSRFHLNDPKRSYLYAELARNELIEYSMYAYEIYRAFNLMPEADRDALAPALSDVLFKGMLGIDYDAADAKFTSPELDSLMGEPADARFEHVQKHAIDAIRTNLPNLFGWDGSDLSKEFPGRPNDEMLHILSDMHCKALEDFRVKNFALMLQMCEEKGVDVSDMRESAQASAFASPDSAPSEDQDFGNVRMGTEYAKDTEESAGKPGEKRQSKATPKLETMSNLTDACDGKYALQVGTVPNDMSLKNAYVKLLKPIEFITRELTKQIREIKTYNTGGKNSGKSRGKLDSHTMYRYKTDPKVFYDTTYKIREMDLAFGILLDQSGSMYGDGIYNGMISLIMLHHVLTSLRINHAIVGHNSHKFNGVDIMKYVAFDEDPGHTLEAPYMLANLHASGGNCDSGALNYMEQYIKRTRNKDKIVLIFSDGEPSECDESDLHAQVRKMEREGIHVIGLGIDFENIKYYYPDNANGRNLSEMVNILVGILKRYVLDKKR